MTQLIQAFRRLIKYPGLTSVIGLTLALGVGVNVAIFDILNIVVLTPLPHPDPAQLVMFEQSWDAHGGWSAEKSGIAATWPTIKSWRTDLHSFAEIVGTHDFSSTIRGKAAAELVRGLAVTTDYFHALGGSPALGRYFVDQDDNPG